MVLHHHDQSRCWFHVKSQKQNSVQFDWNSKIFAEDKTYGIKGCIISAILFWIQYVKQSQTIQATIVHQCIAYVCRTMLIRYPYNYKPIQMFHWLTINNNPFSYSTMHLYLTSELFSQTWTVFSLPKYKKWHISWYFNYKHNEKDHSGQCLLGNCHLCVHNDLKFKNW